MTPNRESHWMDGWLEKSEESRQREAEQDAEIAALYVEQEPNPAMPSTTDEHSIAVNMLAVEATLREALRGKYEG